VDIVALYLLVNMNLKKRLIPMNRTKKILIALAVLVLIVGVVVACVLLWGQPSWRNLTYEEYNALSAEEQEEYFYSFETIGDFFAWYNQAKKEYEDSQDYIEVGGDSDITIGEPGIEE
jgi:flagellar basal body-associated protein FliL